MKLFQDCEIVRQHLRGHTAVTIVGPRAVTADEAAALLAEFADSFGTRHFPSYFSGDGWQDLQAKGPLAARFSFDEQDGIVTVDGNKFAAEVFDSLAEPTPADQWLRVVSTEGGVVTMERKSSSDIGKKPAKKERA